MGKVPCCDGIELKKGPWTPEEDKKLLAYIQQYGHGSWRALPQKAGLRRCGKSCRLRWINYLRPDIKRGQFTTYEEQKIIQLHALLGNRWSVIAGHLPNRTDNEIKNYWNTHIKKRLTKMGIDPMTHKKKHNFSSSNQGMMNPSVIDHIAQWESTRLEAEARLAKHPNILITEHQKIVPQDESFVDDSFMMNPCFDILKAWQSGYANTHVGGQPYTLSFLENAVSMLAVRESSRTAQVAGTGGHSDNNIKNYDNFWSSQNDVAVEEDHTVLFSEVGIGVPLFNEEDCNLEEENYWNKFCTSPPETLYSVVYNN